ncbi:MAG: hypothetical protein CMG55_01455 [Candidatus Marinimicrobia bacterium]|nr:hypothetical protein [Candidatus Neomarinimicrobiota bacterium]|tara:strand:+ start:5210 stop:6481 length:1272 start_codon:yes stop_codon:yes gene_type:complete
MKFVVFFIFLSFLFSKENQTIDGVAAIIEEHIVLKSDLAQMVNMSLIQNKIDPEKETEKFLSLQSSVLQSMIDQKIILKKAELDSVIVEEKEVNSALEQQIEMLIAQAGSEKKAEEILGQSLKDFKREFWYDMQDRLVSERYQQTLISSIKVTRSDVLSFYKTYKDSLPTIPITAKIRHCLIKTKPSDSSKKTSFLFLEKLKKELINGADFSVLANKHSHDPGSKNNGGSLGWVKRGLLVKRFETAAFTAELNSVIGPIETDFGYHLIETLDKKGDKILVRHILNIPVITKKDNEFYFNFATSLQKDSIKTFENFVFYTKKYSQDEKTKNVGGNLGWIDPNNFSIPEIGQAIKHIKIKECSPPINSSLGFHLLWIDKIKKGGRPNITDHWVDIEAMALNKKKMDWYENWIINSRKDIYINILF